MNRSCGPLIQCVIFGLCTIFAAAKIANGAREEASGGIQEMMSPEEFKAAGLDKLTPDELQKLDAWLQGYRQVTEQKAEKIASRLDRPNCDPFGRRHCVETGKRR
ncbi:MAG: hypothetical protein DMF31_03670 [Verrucomicrobia bacterium]|nr:MAG: hypothetical protein DMF31_03670 [Verrucomicrobiota bacterium]